MHRRESALFSRNVTLSGEAPDIPANASEIHRHLSAIRSLTGWSSANRASAEQTSTGSFVLSCVGLDTLRRIAPVRAVRGNAAILTPCRRRYSRLRLRAVRADVFRRCGRCPQLHAELSRPRTGLPASVTGGSENLDRWGARAPGPSRLRCPWSGSTLSSTLNTWLIRFHQRAGLIARPALLGAARFVGSIRFA
jgi:hypothetical protein